MEQVRGELAMANAQELINVSRLFFFLPTPCLTLTLMTIENQRKVLLEVRPQAWL